MKRLAAATVGLLVAFGCDRGPGLLEEVEVAWTGHEEVEVDAETGTLTPVLFGTAAATVCFRAPATLDTSGWQARLFWRVDHHEADVRAPQPDLGEPSRRMASTVCFSLPTPAPGERVALCGQLHDAQTERVDDLPCKAMLYQPARAAPYDELNARFRGGLAAGSMEEIVTGLDRTAREARTEGFPVLATLADLASVHYLVQEKTPSALAAARSRLGDLPGWLDQPEVDTVAGQVASQRARYALAVGWQLARAWQDLREADRHFLRVAEPLRIVVPEAEAGLLARLGASTRAVAHINRAIEECGEDGCYAFFVSQAAADSGFWTLLDPTANAKALAAAERSLERALADTPESLPGGRANILVNLAMARVRQLGDAHDYLRRTRALLVDKTEIGAARVAELAGWADLVEALGALGDGEAGRALTLCDDLVAHELTPRLTAWALDCMAQAHRRQRAFGQASAAYRRLFDFYQYATPQALGQDVPLGPSQRADAFYRAVQVAVELGNPDEAWALLDRLDSLTVSESARRACREQLTDPALIEAWQVRDRRRAELSRRLQAFEAPVSGRRRQQQIASEQATRAELDELARTWPGCVGVPAPVATFGPELRALAVEDEVLVLRRDSGGVVGVDHRTPIPRDDLRRDIEALADALDHRTLDDKAWRVQAERLALALTPHHYQSLESEVAYGLYGLLQGVPLEALPLPGEQDRWLGDVLLPMVVPVGAPPTAMVNRRLDATWLFVVDPTRNLPAAAAMADFYGERFPTARLLRGGEATRGSLLAVLPTASSLHVDAHVNFDAAFPSLSSIELADGPLRLLDLEELELSLAFANLSACDSGRWPITADRGRFGWAGRLIRAGVPWVVASRTRLDDRLAGIFNRAFYEEVGAGATIPAAFASTMAVVRTQFPASTWGALQLLRGSVSDFGKIDEKTFVGGGAIERDDYSQDDERDAHVRSADRGALSRRSHR